MVLCFPFRFLFALVSNVELTSSLLSFSHSLKPVLHTISTPIPSERIPTSLSLLNSSSERLNPTLRRNLLRRPGSRPRPSQLLRLLLSATTSPLSISTPRLPGILPLPLQPKTTRRILRFALSSSPIPSTSSALFHPHSRPHGQLLTTGRSLSSSSSLRTRSTSTSPPLSTSRRRRPSTRPSGSLRPSTSLPRTNVPPAQPLHSRTSSVPVPSRPRRQQTRHRQRS